MTYIDGIETNKKNSQRTPERFGQYEDNNTVDIYADFSRKGVMGIVERKFIKMILSSFEHLSNLKVLDVGTGPAWIPVALAKAKPQWEITAVDASPVMLEKAKKYALSQKVKVHFMTGMADRINLPAETFDLVISHYAFHEFPDGGAAMKEMERLVKPGGFLVIQDLLRPQNGWINVLVALAALTSKMTQDMKRQYEESLRAAYNDNEMRTILSETDLQYSIKKHAWWAGGLMQIWGVKPSSLNPDSSLSLPQSIEAK